MTKKELLEKYAAKNVTAFAQFDVFVGVPPDTSPTPDPDGDCVFAGRVEELMHGPTGLRILVPLARPPSKADILRGLHKVTDWIESRDDVESIIGDAPLPIRDKDIPW